MLDLGDVNSEAGVRAIGEALANASFLNGTCYPSRDDLAAYGSIDASRAPLASDPRTLAWHAAIDALVKTKFKGQGEGVVILPREPLPPPPARITAPDQIVPIVEPGLADEGSGPGSWPPLPRHGERNVLITSALPYVNNEPHLGNIIGCVLSADCYARFCRARRYNTLFVCGTDEYGTATETKAFQEKMTCEEICNKYHVLHAKVYDWFNICFDEFGRTSTDRQTKVAQEIFHEVNDQGRVTTQTIQQLYSEKLERFLADRLVEGTCPNCGYEDARGDQCDKCGALLSPTELIKPRCKLTGTVPKLRDTTHLFLDLTQIETRLQKYIAWRCEGAAPGGTDGAGVGKWSANCQKVTNTWIKGGLRPRCITRDLKWGTPVPLEGFSNKVFYVWFDAPIGYVSITASLFAKRLKGEPHGATTAIGEGKDDDSAACYGKGAGWRQWWQAGRGEPGLADAKPEVELIQFMGKDNIPFHTIMFPATLLGTSKESAGNKWTMMKSISVCEYLTYEGDKFSKSRCRGVFGSDAAGTGIPADVWRYSLLASRPEGNDSDFKWLDLGNRCNGELLANLGNFINRTLSFAHARFGGHIPSLEEMWADSDVSCDDDPMKNPYDDEVGAAILPLVQQYIDAMEQMHLRDGLRLAMACSKVGNQFFQDKTPWVWIKQDDTKPKCARIIATCAGLVYILACLIQPFMPVTTKRILKQMSLVETSYAIDDALLRGCRYPSRLVPPGNVIPKPEVLFEAIAEEKLQGLRDKFSGTPEEDGGKKDKKKDKKKQAKGSGDKGGGAKGGKGGKAAAPTNAALDISRVLIIVGEIKKVWRHPNADSLYCEEIDLGPTKGVKTVVSGLVGKVPLEEWVGRHIVCVGNMKPSAMRGVTSQAMVLAASDKTDPSKVEMVTPPAGSKAGDVISVEGIEGEPDEQMNDKTKKKVFDKIVQPSLTTSDALLVTYNGVPLKTSQGPCMVASLKDATVK